jgi:hypothetical protein
VILMVNQESIENLWPRVEPGIKELLPNMTELDRQRTKALVKRVLHASLQPPDVSNLDYAEKYLLAGKPDLSATRILFEAQEFASSVYHIQQAAEKVMKVYCLGLGALTIDEVYGTHRTPQPILSKIQEWPGSEMATVVSGISDKDYRRLAKDVQKLVNSDRNGQLNLAKTPFSSDKGEFSFEVLLRLSDELMSANPLLQQKEDEVKKVLTKCLPEYTDSIVNYSLIKYGQAGAQCYIFGALTFVHESCTRYPSRHPGSWLEPQDYTRQLGIVQAVPDLTRRIDNTFNLVSEVIAISRSRRR